MSHILIVDDEVPIRNMLVAWFIDKGHKVSEAPDGIIAERMIYQDKYDVVIADIMMPEMDGMELLKQVRFADPTVKFIIMTGHHKHENVPRCLEYNVSRYIIKPFHLEAINRLVEEVLSERETQKISRIENNLGGWLEVDLFSSEESLMTVHNCMQQYLCGYLPPEISKKISFPFYEMVRNAIEWGNILEKERIVSISCMVLSDRVVFKIKDEGKGFDIIKAFSPTSDPFQRQLQREKEGKRPGGYGIEISKKFMDDVFYNEKGNCVIMTKMLPENIHLKPKEAVL